MQTMTRTAQRRHAGAGSTSVLRAEAPLLGLVLILDIL